jgi:23S rRNA pseudouridine1911/1915/1917 synthase
MKEIENIGDLVLYKNNQFIAFNKPSGLPVQEDRTGDKALINLGEIYCKSRLFPLHRIDRPASGVVLFAKTKNAAAQVGGQFQEGVVRKTYLAVVAERPEQDEGQAIHYLIKDGKVNKSKAVNADTKGARRAEMAYRYLKSIDNYHLLAIEIPTGRHHQIRAQLAAMGCPIKGDVKYGFRRKNKDRSIHLHAWKLQFQHPVSGSTEELIALPPSEDPVWAAFQL